MREHPTPEELGRFLTGRLPGESLRSVLRHLPECEHCRRMIEPAFTRFEELSPPAAAELAEYDRALDRAMASARRHASLVGRERSQAAPVLNAVLAGEKGFSELSREDLHRLRGRFSMVEVLLEQSRRLRHSDPAGMIHFAELALFAARRLDGRRYGGALLADLKARTWGELANAYRVGDDFPAAEEALGRAARWAKSGSGDLLLAARLGDLAASLWSDQRRFPLAIQAATRVHEIYQEIGERHLAGRALISRGIFTGYNDEPRKAILDLAEGLASIDEEKEPPLVLAALHAMAWNLVDCGRHRKARILLWKTRDLYQEERNPLNQLRLSWLEGRIYSGMEGPGNLERAEEALQKARRDFKRAGQHFDSALVSLDLAMFWARQGKRTEVKALASEMVATFRRHGIAREAIAALLLARERCDKDWVSDEELRDRFEAIARLVVELRYRPGRRRSRV